MNSSKKIIGTVLLGVGAWFVTNYVFKEIQKRDLSARKLLKREATQEWEGEGGSIIEAKPKEQSPSNAPSNPLSMPVPTQAM